MFVSTATVALALALGTAPAALAQNTQSLTKKEAKKLLKQSEKDLKKAKKAGNLGDSDAAAEHASSYADNMNRLNRGLSSSHMSDHDMLDVAAKVDEATLRHEQVLMDLLAGDKLPEQARSHVEDALAASLRGHDTATEAVLRRGEVELPGGMLNNQSAKAAMRKNNALVKQAERAQKRGDNATVGRSVDQFTANMGTINNALEHGQVEQSDAISVFDRVNNNTSRHISKLEDLLVTVPEEAQAGIQRALDNSVRGRDMATQALQRSRAANIMAGRRGATGAPAGIGGRPSGTGSGGGRPSGVGGGPPSGRPGGGPPN
jgi:hypothetical protein